MDTFVEGQIEVITSTENPDCPQLGSPNENVSGRILE